MDTRGDAWQGGDAYDRYMGRWSRLLAPRFLRWVGAPQRLRWLDVGCGTGALCSAILELCAPAELTGIDPSEGFLATARSRLGARVQLQQTTADRLPLADGAVDRCVSSLVLNFVPDPVAALREMARVTAVNGHVAVCVWDYAGCMEMIRHYWDAASALGLLAPGQNQGERFPLCQPAALAAAMRRAGLRQPEVSGIDIETRFVDFDDYWHPFLGGQGPAPSHAMALDEASRAAVREVLRRRLPVHADGTIVLAARAWAARGSAAG